MLITRWRDSVVKLNENSADLSWISKDECVRHPLIENAGFWSNLLALLIATLFLRFSNVVCVIIY